jgi:cardiolipin synthase
MGPVLTIPNVISSIRIAAVPLFLWMLVARDNPVGAGWLLGAIGATDWIDGFLARRLGQVSELGKVLDPVADRLAIASALVAGWATGTLHWPIALALIVRESIVAAGAAYGARHGIRLEVRYMGKAATLGVYAAVANFIIHSGNGHWFHFWTAWICIVPGLLMYYIVAVQYFFDLRNALGDGVGSEPVEEGGDG